VVVDLVANLLVTGAGLIALATSIYLLNKKVKQQDYEAHKQRQHGQAGRLQTLIGSLSTTSQEVNTVIEEIASDLQQRQETLTRLQAENNVLAAEEETIRRRLEALRTTRSEVAEYFQDLNQQSLERMERRGVRRDLLFFIAGIGATVIVTIIVTITIHH